MILFKVLGAVVALYAIYAVVIGEVYAKSGPGGRRVSRKTAPQYFWVVIVIYAGLAIALITVF